MTLNAKISGHVVGWRVAGLAEKRLEIALVICSKLIVLMHG